MYRIRSIVTLFVAGLLSLAAFRSVEAQQPDTLRLAINDAITRVLRESDEVRIAAAQIELTEAQITTARASGLPQARLASSYSQVLRNARAQIVGQTIFGQNYNYTGNINISQTVFQGGRFFAGTRAAGDARSVARFNRAETESQIAVDVQRAYLTAQLSRELLQIQERNVELATQRLTLAARAGGGLGLLLRQRPSPLATAATTRWQVAAAPSTPDRYGGLGRTTFDLSLNRNRRGRCGRFIMCWDHHERVFLPAALSLGVAAAAFDGSIDPRPFACAG